MQTNSQRPVFVSPKTAILLAFLPLEPRQGGAVNSLLSLVQSSFGDSLKVLRIDAVTHPEVINSFGVVNLPTFVLVQKGTEIWRTEGLPDGQLVPLLQEKIQYVA